MLHSKWYVGMLFKGVIVRQTQLIEAVGTAAIKDICSNYTPAWWKEIGPHNPT